MIHIRVTVKACFILTGCCHMTVWFLSFSVRSTLKMPRWRWRRLNKHPSSFFQLFIYGTDVRVISKVSSNSRLCQNVSVLFLKRKVWRDHRLKDVATMRSDISKHHFQHFAGRGLSFWKKRRHWGVDRTWCLVLELEVFYRMFLCVNKLHGCTYRCKEKKNQKTNSHLHSKYKKKERVQWPKM